jgi:lysophospholipase L1-like esterase
MLKTIVASISILCLLLSCQKPEATYVPSNPVIPNNNPVVPSDTSLIRTYLALGDSYTIGQSVAINERFPVQAVTLLSSLHIKFSQPEIIAQTGWTTGNLLSAIGNTPPSKPSYDIVSLLIGVNNQYQHRTQDEYLQEFTVLLNKSIQYAGNNKRRVFVLSIPDYSVAPFANNSNTAQIAGEIDAFNAINKQIALQYSVNYLDITGFTRQAATNPSLIASDGLHPSGIEYGVWSDKLVPMIRAVLQ